MSKVLLAFVRKPLTCRLHYHLKSYKPGFKLYQGTSINHNSISFYNSQADESKKHEKSLQNTTKSDLSEEVRPLTFNDVKETTKTASYLGVILIGVGVTGLIFYTVFKELFSSKSPNNVYSKSLEKVISDTRVQDALGQPIKGYGEENRRGRRQHVSHLLYDKDGEKRLRMKFYVNGTRKRATVHLEMKEDDRGSYVYRYLFVELDDFGRHPIVLEDNRHSPTPRLSMDSPPDLSSLNMNLNFPDAELK